LDDLTGINEKNALDIALKLQDPVIILGNNVLIALVHLFVLSIKKWKI
jgi:hypothetical protein